MKLSTLRTWYKDWRKEVNYELGALYYYPVVTGVDGEFLRNMTAYERKREWLLIWSGAHSLKYWLRYQICRMRGHDFADEGYASPDSGCIHMVCRHCGYSPGRHWLY